MGCKFGKSFGRKDIDGVMDAGQSIHYYYFFDGDLTMPAFGSG